MYDLQSDLYEDLKKLSNACEKIGISLEDAARLIAELPINLICVPKEIDIKIKEDKEERWEWLDDIK